MRRPEILKLQKFAQGSRRGSCSVAAILPILLFTPIKAPPSGLLTVLALSSNCMRHASAGTQRKSRSLAEMTKVSRKVTNAFVLNRANRPDREASLRTTIALAKGTTSSSFCRRKALFPENHSQQGKVREALGDHAGRSPVVREHDAPASILFLAPPGSRTANLCIDLLWPCLASRACMLPYKGASGISHKFGRATSLGIFGPRLSTWAVLSRAHQIFVPNKLDRCSFSDIDGPTQALAAETAHPSSVSFISYIA